MVFLGSTAMQDNLCSANCVCNYSLDATIQTALGAGVDVAAGVSKLQDCSSIWKSEYDNAGAVLKVLEEVFNCRGFCASPTQEHFSFSDVNKQSVPAQCQGEFDKYLSSVTLGPSGTFFGTGFFCLLMLIVLVVMAISHFRYQNMPEAKPMTNMAMGANIVQEGDSSMQLKPGFGLPEAGK